MGNHLSNSESFLSKGTLEAPEEIGGMRSGGSFAYPMGFSPFFIPTNWVNKEQHSSNRNRDVSLNLGSNSQDNGNNGDKVKKNDEKSFEAGDLFKQKAPLYKFDKNGKMIHYDAKAKNVPYPKDSIIEVN